jgi:DNA-binding NtrC family response regulator
MYFEWMFIPDFLNQGPQKQSALELKRPRDEAENLEGGGQVLVVSPEANHCDRISAAVYKSGLKAYCCRKLEDARFLLLKRKFSAAFCHETLPDGDFQGVVTTAMPTPVVVMSRFAEWDHYLRALRGGAYEYLTCPPDPQEAERITWLAISDCNKKR